MSEQLCFELGMFWGSLIVCVIGLIFTLLLKFGSVVIESGFFIFGIGLIINITSIILNKKGIEQRK